MARGKPNPWMLTVLGVAIAAFLTDQLLAPANAADGTNTFGNESGTPEAAQAQAAAAKPGPTLSDRFDRFADQQVYDDQTIAHAFAPLTTETAPETVTPDVTAEETHALKLTAVLRRDDDNIAVINGRPMAIGKTIDGITVVSIDADSVRVKTPVGPITLTLDRPTLQAR